MALPPLGRQNSIFSIEYYAKLQNAPPPPFVTWAQGFSTQTVGEDLFFGFHLILGQKAD